MAKARITIVSASKNFPEHAEELMRRTVNVFISHYNLSASLEFSDDKKSKIKPNNVKLRVV